MNHKDKEYNANKTVRIIGLAALTVQLLNAAPMVAAPSDSQPLLNDSLPLPELNTAQLERLVRNANARKAAAKSLSKPTTAAATASAPVEKPITKKPLAEKPVVEKPAAEKLVAAKPEAQKPIPAKTSIIKVVATIKPAGDKTTNANKNKPALLAAKPTTTTTSAVAVKPAVAAPTAVAAAANSTNNEPADPLYQTSEQAAPELRPAISSATATNTTTATNTNNSAANYRSAFPNNIPAAYLQTQPSPAQPTADATEAAATGNETLASDTVSNMPQPELRDSINLENIANAPITSAAATNTATTSAPESVSPAVSDSTAADTAADSTNNDGGASERAVAMLEPPVAASGIPTIVIDNDEAVEQEATIEFEPLQTDTGATKAVAGAKFPIVITSQLSSKSAKVGDPVQGRLKYDLKIGDRLVAQKGSVVLGHINYALKARTPMHALVSPNRWYRNSGCLGIAFDEIKNERNEHIPLVAEPAKQALYVKNKGEGRELGINHRGQITGPWSQQLRYKAVRIGLNAAMAPLGTMSFGAMPVALGVMGAINPSFAFMKPVGLNVRHRRLKGFCWGALSGVPGSWLIEDTTVKGQEAIIKPGDEFLAELRQEFTGTPATDAEMMANSSSKVRGEIVGAENNKKKIKQ